MPGAIAVLREPTVEEASRWYTPREAPISARLDVLSEFFQNDAGLRVLKRSPNRREFVFEGVKGSTLRLVLHDDEVSLIAGPSLVAIKPEPEDAEAAFDEVCGIVEVVQLGTGFYVFSDDLVGFDPAGECAPCKLECFEWQSTCVLCEAPLHPTEKGQDEYDARSKRVVNALLRRNLIELVSLRGRRSVETAVAAFYAHGNASIEILHHILMEMPGVAEVYCDETKLFHVLARVT